ncbi:MAG: zinc ribbon domain-containing protein [Lachnospiraceae bacterium]|nr:zinc ribbon domain-containing protein [Lachnospiraceae bacterium]
MKFIGIFILLLLAVVVGGGLYLFFAIRKTAQKFSKELYGTSDISEGMKKAKQQIADTPKSLSAMTRLELPRIVKDFPQFNYDEMKERAEGVLTGYLLGIQSKSTGTLTDAAITSELRKQLEDKIELLKLNNRTEHFNDFKIHRTEISRYIKEKGRCIVTFQTAASALHYVTDDNDNVITGDRDFREQSRYSISMVYIQNRDIVENNAVDGNSLNCPNCGAPISNLGDKICSYCGTGIVEYNIRVWSFDDVSEC